MKWLFTVFLLGQTLITFSQSNNSPKNGIGINLTESGLDGAGLSLRYTRLTNIGGTLKFEINTSFRRAINARIGFEFLQLRLNKFELGVGFDLRYSNLNLSDYGYRDYNYVLLELPIEVRYLISPNYNVFAGISFSNKLWSNTSFPNINKRADLRIGIMHNF